MKVDAIRRAQAALPNDRTEHTVKDRLYRISEELWKRDLPWIQGWKPPTLVKQQPNTENVGRTIWSAIEPFVAGIESAYVASEQGYGTDAELQKAVEDVARVRLMRYFEDLGWSVEDTHLNAPYDARATKGPLVKYLKAKGTSTEGEPVFVTSGEVKWAESHLGECVMGIVSGVSFDESGRLNPDSGDLKLFEWNPASGVLTAVQYQWTPPASR
ncbi:hypothetical protein M3C63_12905 [Brevibacterium luteolum]|uniref:hypothetical protein n=1 Tax=Brevibacterium luteolum TaxID=199591 RepID=UPI00223ABBDC|nr:hypothetical protein [Brevibacterium luteolum]MCT1922748.1 hypothetical protein [Brevibacterium luteolum]